MARSPARTGALAAALGRTVLLAVGVALLAETGPGVEELLTLAVDPVTWLGEEGVDGAVVVVVALLAWACLAWLALAAALVLLARLPGACGRTAGRVAAAVTPRLVRRAAEALLGVTVLTGAVGAGTASAAPAPPVAAATVGSAVQPRPAVPALDRPLTEGRPATPPAEAPAAPALASARGAAVPAADWPAAQRLVVSPPVGDPAPAGNEVVVRRGDTLWGIAARHLGPDASPEAVAAAWPRWHAANGAVVGPDPDLLRPGQVLRPPP